MLRKFCGLVCVAVLCAGFSGCGETGTVDGAADAANEAIDSGAEAVKDAADDAVPEGAKDTVDGAVDKGADMAKDGVNAAAEAAGGSDKK